MNEDHTTAATTAALLQGLQQHTNGLLYRSETDAPFETVYYPNTSIEAITPPLLATWAAQPPEPTVETPDLTAFLRHITTDLPDEESSENQMVIKSQGLQDFLEQHLQHIKVYKVGHRKITAFILGATPTGAIAGLKTTLVET